MYVSEVNLLNWEDMNAKNSTYAETNITSGKVSCCKCVAQYEVLTETAGFRLQRPEDTINKVYIPEAKYEGFIVSEV